jgi:hypothetical protein
MFIHMFAFRWQPGVTQLQKDRAATEIRALQGQITGLLEVWIGTNISPRGKGYEFGGVMKFADQATLDAYPAQPAHQRLLAWLVPLIDAIEVDFKM